MCVYVHVHLWISEGGVGVPGATTTDGCELPRVSAGN